MTGEMKFRRDKVKTGMGKKKELIGSVGMAHPTDWFVQVI